MNILYRDQQIEIVAHLVEGTSIRSVERLTSVHRDTIMRLGLKVGLGCAELHDRTMVRLGVPRLELDELWQFVGKNSANVKPSDSHDLGDQYTFIAAASSAKAIVAYFTGKCDGISTQLFTKDLSERILGRPRDFFRRLPAVSHGGSCCLPWPRGLRHDRQDAERDGLRKEPSQRYSPAAVVAVSRDVICGVPGEISTSYVERGNLSVRTGCKRFVRLTLAHSKKLDNHLAAISLYVVHYNFCRVHEALTPNARHQNSASHGAWAHGSCVVDR